MMTDGWMMADGRYDGTMQTYVILMDFTTKGAETLGASAKRFDRFEEGIKALGGRVLSSYGLLGEHDVLIIVELPDERAAFKTLIKAAIGGTARSKTFTAIPLNEFYALAKGVVDAQQP